MDKTAQRRSLRIKNRKITSDSEHGEPESKKRAILRMSNLRGHKESSDRDRERPETGGSLTSSGPCSIQRLPPEVLAMIFSYSSSIPCYGWKTLNLQLVCKDWYDVYTQYMDTKVYFHRFVPHVQFENCGFRRFAIRFRDVNLSELPESMWKKIGCEVRSLTLQSCKVGDQGLKYLIMHCCHLKSLTVLLHDNEDDGDLFCSPHMLRELNITQKYLKTFKIMHRYRQKSLDVTNWYEIFKAFLTVFPNVTHYAAGHYCPESLLKFTLSNKQDENNLNAYAIITSLVFSLSTDKSLHRYALDTVTSLRLKDISLGMNFLGDGVNYAVMLAEFYYNDLECIEVTLDEKWKISDTMLKIFFLKIFKHCSKLRKLFFHIERSLNLDLAETLFLQLRTICPSLEELSLNYFKFSVKHSLLSYNKKVLSIEYREPFLRKMIETYPDLQHLDLGYHFTCTDDMLQHIFKNLVNLKTLIMKLGSWNTNAGIAGNLIANEDGSFSSSGYSINRLKSLEKLDLRNIHDSQLDDTILYKFNFPELRYLEIDPPEDLFKCLPNIARNMPSLETIHFGHPEFDYPSTIMNVGYFSTKSMLHFVHKMKKLRTMKLYFTTRTSYRCKTPTLKARYLSEIFLASPSLHCIEGQGWTRAHYLRDSNKIMILDHQSGLNIIEH